MQSANFYAAAGLDRAAHLRADAEWLARALASDAYILPVWKGRNMVMTGDTPVAALLPIARAEAFLSAASETVFLGIAEGRPVFAVDLSHHDDPKPVVGAATGEEFVDLRSVGAQLTRLEGSLLAYARGILHWHLRHRFCGVCGSPTEAREGGHVRVCVNPQCGAQNFPRTDPAVIMLVSKGDKCLLGRKAEWPPQMYSSLAGFVEPGESLEDAVAREVMEEVGVAITDIQYHSSQPWPFPASLMLGFFATAVTDNIQINDEELEDARWFSRAELAAGGAGIAMRPRSDSIARRLIETWVAKG